jgi:hypothetical protein
MCAIYAQFPRQEKTEMLLWLDGMFSLFAREGASQSVSRTGRRFR